MCKTLFMIIYITMSLMVRVRQCGDSMAITLPAQVAKMHNINRGDYMEISPIGNGEFKIKKGISPGCLSSLKNSEQK